MTQCFRNQASSYAEEDPFLHKIIDTPIDSVFGTKSAQIAPKKIADYKTRSQLERRSVYRDNKYTDKLADNYDFMPKVVALDDAQHIIDVINETAQKYGQYYQQHDAWNHEADNLTHRPVTPWSIAHAKG